MKCPYCKGRAEWVENSQVYGKNYGKSWMIWLCRRCDAYVGCHENTRKPLGTMADKETRGWRRAAHHHLDKLWKSGAFTRREVYDFLKLSFGRDVHVGESDVETCRKIISITATT